MMDFYLKSFKVLYCMDVRASLAIYWWQRVITFSWSILWVKDVYNVVIIYITQTIEIKCCNISVQVCHLSIQDMLALQDFDILLTSDHPVKKFTLLYWSLHQPRRYVFLLGLVCEHIFIRYRYVKYKNWGSSGHVITMSASQPRDHRVDCLWTCLLYPAEKAAGI
jgi:hypothetical protein